MLSFVNLKSWLPGVLDVWTLLVLVSGVLMNLLHNQVLAVSNTAHVFILIECIYNVGQVYILGNFITSRNYCF